ncbi:hypothetical protein Y1Q_0004708 [Alligator mississippiensis]|uniref:Uncharacterized protein n=1 Tax=Alligator mississippiensis TaxID=8496 RepID=A0A151NL23_ALLMI|nr:hypothetical protein Y1Q_0004708 [Alligator mississippiensis]
MLVNRWDLVYNCDLHQGRVKKERTPPKLLTCFQPATPLLCLGERPTKELDLCSPSGHDKLESEISWRQFSFKK